MIPAAPTIEIVNALPRLPPRSADSNKGNFGRVLVVGGSRGMAGATILCGSAALRAGAGLVKVAVPSEILPTVAAGNPCYTTFALAQDEEGRIAHAAMPALLKLMESHDVLAVGPGLDRGPWLTSVVTKLAGRCPKPMVIDADGLNAFVNQPAKLHAGGYPRILTPHPGEFARLVQLNTNTVQARRRELAINFAREHECILVLKGRGTVVTDGRQLFENETGNPGLATGGTGDVLTGVIAALVGQGLGIFEAAQLGVYLHGLAGDLARDEVGEISLIATDVLRWLPEAFRRHHRSANTD